MPTRYQVVITGFETMEQASKFIDWLSNSGEQDPGIETHIGASIQVNTHRGKIWHPSGIECKIDIFHNNQDENGGCDYEDEDEQWGYEYHP